MCCKTRNKINVKTMCTIAKVSRSGYYNYLKFKDVVSNKDLKDEVDFAMVKAAYDYKGWKKGARQIKMRIHRDYGVVVFVIN